MRPILFDKSATNFTTNGIGRLECIRCHVVEERNGMYELEAVVPINGEHTADVGMESIIGVIPNDGGTLQAFRVYKVGKPINGKFSVYARHISYLLSDIPTMPFTVSSSPSACANTLAGLKNNAIESCPFNFYTDVTTAASYRQSAPASIRERLGGVEGSVLDQFGGEYEWDNFDVHLWKQRGRLANVTGITLRYGKNITDINQEEAISNTVTGVVPYWVDTEGNNLVTLPEKVIYSSHSTDFAYHLTQVLDLSSNFEEQPTVSQLRTYANTYVNKSGFGVPKVSIKVSFVNLWETEEYKDIAPLERVKLCDEINVEFEKLGITAVAKVVKTDYDVLKERYISIEVGSVRSTLAQAVTDREKEVDSAFLNQLTRVGQQIADATAWLTSANGYVVAVKNTDGSWKELLFMDTNDPSTAHNVLRINNNGIGFSTNGINGPYNTAWTIDGRLGDAANKNYWNFLTGEFRLSATAGIDVNANEANYTGAYVPTNSNIPAVNWTTDQKKQHVGETFRDVSSGGKTYIYKVTPAAIPESNHPYGANEDAYYRFDCPSGWSVAYLTFDSQCETEGGNYDYLDFYFMGYDGMYKSRLQGTSFAGKTYMISFFDTHSFYLHWHSDSSVNKWGWKFAVSDSGSGTDLPDAQWESLPSASWTLVDLASGGTYEWVESTITGYIDAKSGEVNLTQEEIFNILTNNGQTQGLFLLNGKVYLNGEYFATNALIIGRNPTTGLEPYLKICNSSGTEIGRWDKNGIEANAGKFGKLHVLQSDGNTFLKYITSSGRVYIDKSWAQGQLKSYSLITEYRLNPYKEGWLEDGYINVTFNMPVSRTSYQTDVQCIVRIYKHTYGNMHLERTVNLLYNGTVKSSSGSSGSGDGTVVIDEDGNVVENLLGYTFDHTFGANADEWYQLKFQVTKRSSSYANGTTTLVVDDNKNGSGFILRETSDHKATCTGKFDGEISGQGVFDSVSVGDYISCESGDIATSTNSYGAIMSYDGIRVWSGAADFGDSNNKMQIFHDDICKESGGTDYYAQFSSSDERVKEDIEDLDHELSKNLIDGTRTREFTFVGSEGRHYGVIAQEARELLNNLGEEDSQLEYIAGRPDGKIPNQRNVNYNEYIPHLINYVKDLRAEIESLKEEIADINRR